MDKLHLNENLFLMTANATTRRKTVSQATLVAHLTKHAMTTRQQEFLTLYYIDRKNMPEIARLYGVNKSTVSRTIHRALHKLRTYLDCGEPTDWE